MINVRDRKTFRTETTLYGVLHGGLVRCDNSQFPAIYTRVTTPNIWNWLVSEFINKTQSGRPIFIFFSMENSSHFRLYDENWDIFTAFLIKLRLTGLFRSNILYLIISQFVWNFAYCTCTTTNCSHLMVTLNERLQKSWWKISFFTMATLEKNLQIFKRSHILDTLKLVFTHLLILINCKIG